MTAWEGVRNYQARNFMQKMKVNDRASIFFSVSSFIAIIIGLFFEYLGVVLSL